jgi:branched-chain amino acid transport system substrate-binding protein
LKRVGYTGPIYHGAGASIHAFVDIGKANVEGAIVGVGALNVYDQIKKDNPLRPVLAKFAELYDGVYGKGKVDLFAGQSWDAMMLAVNAYQRRRLTQERRQTIWPRCASRSRTRWSTPRNGRA